MNVVHHTSKMSPHYLVKSKAFSTISPSFEFVSDQGSEHKIAFIFFIMRISNLVHLKITYTVSHKREIPNSCQ